MEEPALHDQAPTATTAAKPDTCPPLQPQARASCTAGAHRTDGRLTIANLAAEAGLTRQQAYRSPVSTRGATPPATHPLPSNPTRHRLRSTGWPATSPPPNSAPNATDKSKRKPATKPRRSQTHPARSTRKTNRCAARLPTHASSHRSLAMRMTIGRACRVHNRS